MKENLDENGKETGPICKCEPMYPYAKSKDVPDFLYRITSKYLAKDVLIDDDDKKNIKNKNNILRHMCPEGHGFYTDINKIKPFPFDIFWHDDYYTENNSVDKARKKYLSEDVLKKLED